MQDGVSEVDDPRFFFAKNGKTNAKSELEATLTAFYNETRFDDNASSCLFPARKAWLTEKLKLKDLPKVKCTEYDKVLQRLDPQSATIVFPAAHINSPASMFGHTFLRINSSYNSKLLSYAVNYAADADADTTNGVVFAIKGLFGGYLGRYSLLPYYDKLKEYRDTEQRDIWEYDLNLSKEETQKMVAHIWELNSANSFYYFFTENCSYAMLWLLEIARPSLDLRSEFPIDVIPLETIHVLKEAQLLDTHYFRPSKRTILLAYEDTLHPNTLHLPKALVKEQVSLHSFLESTDIALQEKRYILEASIEFLEYTFTQGDIPKEEYLQLFHRFSTARAKLGKGEKIHIARPTNPVQSHRAIRIATGFGEKGKENFGYLGLRPAYHSLQDSSLGFLRGTQIEFLNMNLSYTDHSIRFEDATLLSIVSLAQRSEFFELFSWRAKFALSRDFLDAHAHFQASVGAGVSWGNDFGYIYTLIDPFFYMRDSFNAGIGTSVGLIIDSYKIGTTKVELTNKYHESGKHQWILEVSQGLRLQQNLQLQIEYDLQDKYLLQRKTQEQSLKAMLHYYF